MKTRAAVAFAPKQPLEIVELDLEGPKAGEVLVEIMATGVCHTDAYTLDGFDSEGIFPSVLGHEGAGVVREVGEGVTEFEVEARATRTARVLMRGLSPALRVLEHLVGRVDLLELLLGRLVALVPVRVILERELAVGRLDNVVRGIARHAQDFERIDHRNTILK